MRRWMKISLSETVPYGLAHRTQRAALKEKAMIYICEICEAWKDDDYIPAEFLKFDKVEQPVCDNCFIEQSEDE